jgi:hypothetical protein
LVIALQISTTTKSVKLPKNVKFVAIRSKNFLLLLNSWNFTTGNTYRQIDKTFFCNQINRISFSHCYSHIL